MQKRKKTRKLSTAHMKNKKKKDAKEKLKEKEDFKGKNALEQGGESRGAILSISVKNTRCAKGKALLGKKREKTAPCIQDLGRQKFLRKRTRKSVVDRETSPGIGKPCRRKS